jgi:hypothetical protein
MYIYMHIYMYIYMHIYTIYIEKIRLLKADIDEVNILEITPLFIYMYTFIYISVLCTLIYIDIGIYTYT